MKKLLTLIAFWAMMMTANAQLVQFGVNGDVAFDQKKSSKNVDGGKAIDPDLGWSAGVKLKVSFPLGLGFDLGVRYAQQDLGYICSSMESGSDGSGISLSAIGITDKVKMVSVPINLRYDIKLPAIRRAVIPFAFAGPEFCYTVDGINWKNLESTGRQLRDEFKENDANWNFNFGFGVIIARHVELSYIYSIRMTESLDWADKHVDDQISSLYKTHRNKIGLTIYF